jgi:hypothetical protein
MAVAEDVILDDHRNMFAKEKSRALRVAIRHVLMSHWDPIGVSDVPEASDEYDGYIGGVCDLLKDGAKDESIAEYLRCIEVDRMGLTDAHGRPLVPDERRAAAVSALQLLKSMPPTIVPIGAIKSFGAVGPKYQIGQAIRSLEDGDLMVEITLIETGEKLE